MIKNFKEKYIKNLFFYHIYRFVKYKFSFFKSYGATGEDVLLNKIFKNNKGFYIDVGALHPINGSLTHNLYKKGWTGLNFDIDEKNIRFFKIFRRRDSSFRMAISSSKGKVNSYIFSSGSGLNTLERSWAEKWSKLIGKDYFIQKLNKTTLTSVVKKFRIHNKIDLLNIDVEGHEIEVLNGSDFKLFRPKIITIEIHVKKTEDIFRTRVFKILQKNKYELISHYYHTCFFKAVEFEIETL